MDKVRSYLAQIWQSRDLRNKVLFTVGILLFIRIITHIPMPGIDKQQLLSYIQQGENQVFGVLSMFTGGTASRLSIDLLGVGPYITASIIVQLLQKVIPQWEAISKEGQSGREKLNSYTRYLTVPMAIVQGYGMIAILKSQGVFPALSSLDMAIALVAITATSLFVMWLGELISERGIGNGISLIIALGIVSGIPQQIVNTASVVEGRGLIGLIAFIALALVTIATIVWVNGAERRIPIVYARQTVGARTSRGIDSFLPIKINIAGVIPIIFALSFLTFPVVIARFLQTASSEKLANIATALTDFLNNNTYYGILYFILVFVFTFFYTYIVFQPEEISENLQKQGSFTPGIRPGTEMIGFLKFIIARVTFIGAVFLAVIAILPYAVQLITNISTITLTGTSILIVVSVVLETVRALNGQISMHKYDTVK